MKNFVVCRTGKNKDEVEKQLSMRVEELINDGWKLDGDISVTRYNDGGSERISMVQALQKE